MYGSLIFSKEPKQYANFKKTGLEGEVDERLVQNTHRCGQKLTLLFCTPSMTHRTSTKKVPNKYSMIYIQFVYFDVNRKISIAKTTHCHHGTIALGLQAMGTGPEELLKRYY